MLTDFFLKCGIFWVLSTCALLLVADGGASLDWWAPLSVPWRVAIVLAPPIGLVGLVAAVRGAFWLARCPARKRSRRARVELDGMRRERMRLQEAKAAGEGEAG